MLLAISTRGGGFFLGLTCNVPVPYVYMYLNGKTGNEFFFFFFFSRGEVEVDGKKEKKCEL